MSLGPLATNRAPWTTESWKSHPVAQPVVYEDEESFTSVLAQLNALQDLVPYQEIDNLRTIMQHAARGQMFVIQGGDCAEAFNDVQQDIVNDKRSLLMEQAGMLSNGLGMPVVPIGRIAGQYAKPRSSMMETLPNGSLIYAFRGDNVNSLDISDRVPDHERLCTGFHYAAATLGMLRAQTQLEKRQYDSRYLPTSGIYTSHEALHLPLESAMTRYGYNTSAHMIWIGERTRQLDGAHVEYMRGIKNPIGVKIGPTTVAEELIDLLDTLNPDKIVGKVTLITRLGFKNVDDKLPGLVKAVKQSNHLPVWLCDPCHGNTVVTPSKVKTRIVEQMMEELRATHRVHLECGSRLGGIHLEQTGETDVTECVDSRAQRLDEATFPAYRSRCDPRLSRLQAQRFTKDFIDFVPSVTNKIISSITDPVASVATPSWSAKDHSWNMLSSSEARDLLGQEGAFAVRRIPA